MFARLATRHLTLHLGGALTAVVSLCAIPAFGARWLAAHASWVQFMLMGALACFCVGITRKIARWMRAPVAFRIPLTTGQQRALPSIAQQQSLCPHTTWQVVVRVLLDGVLFRPLLRVTPTAHLHGSRLSGNGGRSLWLFTVAFHGSLAVIVVRHLRLFLTPVPRFVSWLQGADSLSELLIPKVHVTSLLILLGLGLLIGRRLVLVRLRYISLAADYFPLLLLAGIAITGVLMRHVIRTDITAAKAMVASGATLSLAVPQPVDTALLVHVFLVCALLVYFPLSKLMHVPGAFMSPTLTLANNNRAVRHINVCNPEVQTLHYSEYEATYRERMIEAGLPVEES